MGRRREFIRRRGWMWVLSMAEMVACFGRGVPLFEVGGIAPLLGGCRVVVWLEIGGGIEAVFGGATAGLGLLGGSV